jgi:hypothetical protein
VHVARRSFRSLLDKLCGVGACVIRILVFRYPVVRHIEIVGCVRHLADPLPSPNGNDSLAVSPSHWGGLEL